MNFSEPVEIFLDGLTLKKEDGFRLNIEVKDFNLDAYIKNVMIKKQEGVVRSILDAINNNSEGKVKYELISSCFEWMNKYHILDIVMHEMAAQNEKVNRIIQKYNISIGDIRIE